MSRAQQKYSAVDAAARVAVPASADVCVVGGGAAGLTAAICAAERGASVVVLERDVECGRTILATGNGRCNFANSHLNPACYNDPTFVQAVVGGSWFGDITAFLAQAGLAWKAESQGRCYPLSRQASSVRNVLLLRAKRAGVTLVPMREVDSLEHKGNWFVVHYQDLFAGNAEHALTARRVVVATGGGATRACERLELVATPPHPLLCPLACEGPALESLDGRRTHAKLALLRNGKTVASETGEVLFRAYGLSGIVVFNLSRYAKPGDVLMLDLLPTIKTDEARRLATHTLDGLLDPAIAHALEAQAKSIDGAIRLAKDLRYRVVGPTQTNKAQVRRGGLVTSQFEPATLQARAIPGLFACGEALDVDGPCGGFNLAWAWKSGMVAGAAAGETNVQGDSR